MSLFFSYSKTASFVHETQMFDYRENNKFINPLLFVLLFSEY